MSMLSLKMVTWSCTVSLSSLNLLLTFQAISEHIENAGVHSGDATLVFPAQDLDEQTIADVKSVTERIARQLNVNGSCFA